jgi:hypothetical protein
LSSQRQKQAQTGAEASKGSTLWHRDWGLSARLGLAECAWFYRDDGLTGIGPFPQPFPTLLIMTPHTLWKTNRPDTQRRFEDWWNHRGLLVGMWGAPVTDRCIHQAAEPPIAPATLEERYTNATFRAMENHCRLARSVFPLDVLPSATTDLGQGQPPRARHHARRNAGARLELAAARP